jgi:hypothetical protein
MGDLGAGIAQSVYRRVRFPAGARDFYRLHSVQTASGCLPSLLFSGYWRLFPGVRRPRLQADRSSLSSTRSRIRGSMHPPPPVRLYGTVLN